MSQNISNVVLVNDATEDFFDSPMFRLVDPNDICPMEILNPEMQDYPFMEYSKNVFDTIIEPPPTLISHENPKPIQEQLRLRKALSIERQEILKKHLDSQPARIVRKSGRKMTGRERQIELERQEAQQLSMRKHYLDLINQLEQKCSKLREILENIVTTSPEYNIQLANFLETSELSFDQPNSTTVILPGE